MPEAWQPVPNKHFDTDNEIHFLNTQPAVVD